jgi:transcriptional regulator with XRE-family HTH domain
MLTGVQIRAARHALKWTFEQLAKESSVSLRTLKSLEIFDGVPECRTTTMGKIRKAFEAAGIEFIGTPEDRPGIRLTVSK